MKNKFVKFSVVGLFAALPSLAFALPFKTYTQILSSTETLIDWTFGLLLAIAVFMVAFGIFKFIINAGNEQARKEGRSAILWGVVGIFIMVSIWGLVNLLSDIVELDTDPLQTPNIVPDFNGGGDDDDSWDVIN